jgi:hypothetical protein
LCHKGEGYPSWPHPLSWEGGFAGPASAEYVAAVAAYGGDLDLIVVDGRARNALVGLR